jgi:putative ABC transport system substrate-binding protein
MRLHTVGLIVMLALGMLIAPRAAGGQPGGKVYRIGVLETTSAALNIPNLDAFRQGLRELGYLEGQNLVIAYRSADGRPERFPDLATELVRLPVDLILTRGTPAALAAKQATQGTVPVVITGAGDPVGSGLVASLARPGGNVTGLSALTTELYAKRVELLADLMPKLARLAGLFNMGNPVLPSQWTEVERASRPLGVQPQLLDVRTPEEIGRAFDAAIREHADALVVAIEALTQAHRRPIVDLAAQHRLPAMYAGREFVDAGGLISYGVSYPDMYYRAASFAHKIFTGTKPADLPVEQPMRFELVINLKTAQALGLTIPPVLLFRADEVIQ